MIEETRAGEWCGSTAVAAARAVAFIASAQSCGEAQARVVELAVRLLGAASGFLCESDAMADADAANGILDLMLQGECEQLGRLVLIFDADVSLDRSARQAGENLAEVLAEGLQVVMNRVAPNVAQASDEARRQREWNSIIAHDLRQPLSALVVQIGMLRRYRTQTRIEPLLAQMLRSTQVLERMISDLVDTSELDAHGLSVRLRPVDLSEVLRDFSARVGGALTGRRLIVRGGDTLAPVRADPERLEQVLWNLISNAVKYGRADAPVEVHLQSDAQGSRISVRNEGTGITKEDLVRLFRRFERLNRPEDAETKGLGLGLYIAQGLVGSHGGRIWAESTPGAETFFHIWLPCAAGDEQTAQARPPPPMHASP
jgi:signal transduction histidine kinase